MHRIIRAYRYCARITHHCDDCLQDIHPGQRYEGSVEAWTRGLVIFKRHVDPECDWPADDPDDECAIPARTAKVRRLPASSKLTRAA